MQGGFIPDVILYLSYFYTKTEREFFLILFLDLSSYTSTFDSAAPLSVVLGIELHG